MKSALPSVLRMLAILLLAGGICLGVLDAYGAAKSPVSPEESFASRLPALAQAVAIVLGLAGVGGIMYGLGTLMETEPDAGSNGELSRNISELRQSLQKLESAAQRMVEARSEPPAGHALSHPVELAAGDTVAGSGLTDPESMHQILAMLQEIRELALADEYL